MWSIHPNQIPPIVEALRPDFSDVETALDILAKAQDHDWGPVQHGGKLHDRILPLLVGPPARARSTGMPIPAGSPDPLLRRRLIPIQSRSCCRYCTGTTVWVVIDKPPGSWSIVPGWTGAKPDSRYSSAGPDRSTRLARPSSGPRNWGVDLRPRPERRQHFSGTILPLAKLPKPTGLVRGHPPEQLTIDHPLDRVEDPYCWAQPILRNPRSLHRLRRARALPELDIPIDRYPTSRYALVELLPVSWPSPPVAPPPPIAHPIIGDATYGKGRHNASCRALRLPSSASGLHGLGGATPTMGEVSKRKRQWATPSPRHWRYWAGPTIGSPIEDSSSSWRLISSRSINWHPKHPGKPSPPDHHRRRRPGHAESRPQPSCEGHRPGGLPARWSADL